MIDTTETGTTANWFALYPDHVEPRLRGLGDTLAGVWSARVQRAGDRPALRYFDASYTASEVDGWADALAAELQSRGVRPGDAVGIQLQNVPQFAIAMLALWRIGGVALVLNPMYRDRELRTILADARPVGVIGASGETAAALQGLGADAPKWCLGTSECDVRAELARLAERGPDAPDAGGSPAEADLLAAIADRAGERPAPAAVAADSPALLTYTSGTTGDPKGAVATHANLLATAEATRSWLNVRPGDRVLAVAPLFHITGAVATAAMSLACDAELVFIGRLQPEVFLDAIRDLGVHHILGSITVYNALLDLSRGDATDLRSLRTVYSGGAPVPPKTVERFRERFGHYIRNVYGMTETASAVVAVPLGATAPVDEASGTLAIGVPMPGTEVRVRTEQGRIAGPRELGELEIRGASCTAGYLDKPEATAATIVDGWLRTGDVAFVDEAGWVYLVDRKKDQINVSGYKVWPREVEDVLYEHAAVREAAVLGRPNEYSGEEVVAFVSLQAGRDADPVELREHVKTRLAAYKCPREVVILPDLPKTATGKIQRRALREPASET